MNKVFLTKQQKKKCKVVYFYQKVSLIESKWNKNKKECKKRNVKF